MKNPYFRRFVVFTLLLCFICSALPSRVSAVDPLTLSLVSAAVGVPILLAWVGISADPAHMDTFQTVVDNFTLDLKSSGFINSDNMLSIFQSSDGLKTYFQQDVLRHAIDYLYKGENPVLNASDFCLPDTLAQNDVFMASWGKVGKYYGICSGIYWYSDNLPVVERGFFSNADALCATGIRKWDGSAFVRTPYHAVGLSSGSNNYTIALVGAKTTANVPIVMGNVARPLDDPEKITPEIMKPHIIEAPYINPNHPKPDDPEHNKTRFFPTKIDIEGNPTQDDVQNPGWNKDPGTDPDPNPDPNPNPDPGTDPSTPDPDPGTNPGKDPPPFDKMTLDLKEFFPFCIPFDLYGFFSCLAADPVTPSFSWDMPIPGGQTYTFKIDLKDFDGVAAVCRKLMALLFTVGLAVKTRDLIKG